HELALGWISHYAVGILYGVMFAIIMGSACLAAPTFLPSWIFGIVTVGAGWFLLQPGLGIDYTVNITRPDDPIMEGIADFPYTSEQYY
ncbi:DUF2938 family protein, partial [Rhizobium johnstonii]